jgi:AraC family transcriptional regulator
LSYFQSSIISEVQLAGARAEIVTYSYDENARVTTRESEVTVGWRIKPSTVEMTARLHDGSERKFGRLMLFQPNDTFVATAHLQPESTTILKCHLKQDWLFQQLGDEANLVSRLTRSALNIHDTQIDMTMRCMAIELMNMRSETERLIELWLSTLAFQLVRHARLAKSSNDAKHLDLAPSIVRDVERMIGEAPRPLKSAEIARRCGISERHLRRIFKQSTGQSLQNAIYENRLHRAQKLLLETDLQLKAISHMLGYSKQGAFTHAVKKSTGKTPFQIRHDKRF